MNISVIFVNYNTKELILDSLTSVFEKTKDISFEVIVVDNASKDGSCKAIAQNFPQVKIIKSPENLGFGRGNNLGIKEAQGKYVFLLNTDTVLINNAIKILFDFIEQDEKIAVCGGDLLNKDSNRVHAYGFLNTPKKQLLRLLGLRYFAKNAHDDMHRDKAQEVEQVIGADMLIRKSVLDEVGLFDDRFFMYREESELQFRIRKAGYKICYTPEAKIFHFEGSSSKNNRKFRRRLISQSEYLYFIICYPKTPKIFFRIMCSLPNIYRIFSSPKDTIEALKYIWTH